MIVFWHLLLAHLLADFTLHTDYIYQKKISNPFKGLTIHGLVYLVCLVICCLPYLEINWFTIAGISFNGVETIFLLTLIHILSDFIDISDNHDVIGINALMFLCWQIIEIAVLFIVAPFIPVPETKLATWILKFIIILNGLIISSHLLMVLIHLSIKDFVHKNYPTFDERYVSMIYRTGLYMSLVLPSDFAFITALIWIICLFIIFQIKQVNFMSAKNITGTIITIFIAFGVRWLIYHVY